MKGGTRDLMSPGTSSGTKVPTSTKQAQKKKSIQMKLPWWMADVAFKPPTPNVAAVAPGPFSPTGSRERDKMTTELITPSQTGLSPTAIFTTERPLVTEMPKKQSTPTLASQITVASLVNHPDQRIFDVPLGEDAMDEDELMERPMKRRVVGRPSTKKEMPGPAIDSLEESITRPPVKVLPTVTCFSATSTPEHALGLMTQPQNSTVIDVPTTLDEIQDYTAIEEKEAKLAAKAARAAKRGAARAGKRASGAPLPETRHKNGAAVDAQVASGKRTRGQNGSMRRGRITRTWMYFTELQPQYLEFMCEWQGCPAKLFNMDTMRRHMEIVHMRRLERRMAEGEGGAVMCLWADCADTCGDKKGVGRVFESVKALREHMEEGHMVPMSWHMGDGPVHDPDNRGPQVLRIGEPLPDYLFDSDGNQVTPDIRNQKVESVADKKARMRRLRKFMAEVFANLPDAPE